MKLCIGLFTTILLALSNSCIENNVPYPVTKIEILSIEGEGFTVASGDIDTKNHVATLHLDETTDISKVVIKKVVITENGKSSIPLEGTFDLRSPISVTLSLYQNYEWTIVAQQTITRTFAIEGQVGQSEFDLAARTATAYVPKKTDLKAIKVTALKLGPREITTMNPTMEELTDFTSVRYVDLTYHTFKERWRLYVVPTDVSVRFTQADAWAKIVWLTAAGQSGAKMGFRYRLSGSENWLEIPQEQITIQGGSFSTKVTGLTPATSYDFEAYANDEHSPVTTLTTEEMQTLINGGFEAWSVAGKIVYPYAEGETPYWSTGNPGAKIASITLTEATDDIRPGSAGHAAAQLKSQFANIVGIGKFAAGNIFLGTYVKTDGTNGIVDFGRPFKSHPTTLHGWVKYTCGTIDKVLKMPAGTTLTLGDPDNGMIYIALGDWDPAVYGGTAESPVQVRTRAIEETYFDPHGPAVIAYGEMPLNKSIEKWTEFSVELQYNSTSRVPTHIMIVCSASRWGDYFTGSTQSVMWVDDLELRYE
ncbi:MAG: PCMD domain-containing protein [Alistipes sp.]